MVDKCRRIYSIIFQGKKINQFTYCQTKKLQKKLGCCTYAELNGFKKGQQPAAFELSLCLNKNVTKHIFSLLLL